MDSMDEHVNGINNSVARDAINQVKSKLTQHKSINNLRLGESD